MIVVRTLSEDGDGLGFAAMEERWHHRTPWKAVPRDGHYLQYAIMDEATIELHEKARCPCMYMAAYVVVTNQAGASYQIYLSKSRSLRAKASLLSVDSG